MKDRSTAKGLVHYLGLTPRHALAARREAERAETSGNLDHALDTWMLALALAPTEDSPWHGAARVLRRLGRSEESRQILASLLALKKRSSS